MVNVNRYHCGHYQNSDNSPFGPADVSPRTAAMLADTGDFDAHA